MSAKKPNSHHKTEIPEPTLLPYPTPAPQAVRYMYIGVISFAVIIVIIWFWSLKQQVTKMIVGKPLNSYLINQTQANWNAAFTEQQKNQADLTKTKLNLKTIISGLVTKNSTSSATIINTSTIKQ